MEVFYYHFEVGESVKFTSGNISYGEDGINSGRKKILLQRTDAPIAQIDF